MKKYFRIFMLFIFSICFAGCEFSTVEINLTLKIKDNKFRIAQFADLHFGIEGERYHNADINKTIKFMDHIVESSNPDLIVLSGDNIMNSGVNGMKKLVNIMDKYQTPWTLVYGNHDAELFVPGYSKKEISTYLMTCKSSYLLYQHGYIEDGKENRYGNFSISIKNEFNDLIGAIILMDSGTYDYGLDKYQEITNGQIDWYANEIDTLQKKYDKDGVIPSILFNHIPLDDFFSSYGNKDNEIIISQNSHMRFFDNENEESNFFKVIKEKNSTKAFFVGHTHMLKYQVKVDDLVLGFAPQTARNQLAYVYEFDTTFAFNTIQITNE